MNRSVTVRRSGAWILALALAAASGCSGDDDAAADGNSGGSGGRTGFGNRDGGASGTGAGTGSGGDGSSGSGAANDGGGVGSGDGGLFFGDGGVNILELCGGPCACADGVDNDGDDSMDGFDTECTGPADNDEGSFATGIPGDNRDPKWQDCFFDGNSGAGDDGCRYHTDCLTGDTPQDDPDCTLTQQCVDYCRPLTPSGCDCFGCCTIRTADGTELDVLISAQCQEDNLADCVTCTKSTLCDNDCGECELCPGRTVADLPASCSPPPGGSGGSGGSGGTGGSDGAAGNPGYTCDDGTFYCNEQDDCPSTSYYCSFGCCRLQSPD